MADVKITVRNNGPFRIEAPEGSVELVDHDGNKYDLSGQTRFSLCRCGASANQPYCDGMHKTLAARTEPAQGSPDDKSQA
jgi:CDGSH-type Zn-finger protein